MTNEGEDEFLTRREAELLTTLGDETESIHLAAHRREHEQEASALNTALSSANQIQNQHNTAHDKAHSAHELQHEGEGAAVRVALASVGRERDIHATAHEMEHEGHQREHTLVEKYTNQIEALQKEARQLMRENIETRLLSTNEWRQTVSDTLTTRASIEKVEAQNDRIVNIEKVIAEGRGKGIGQGAIVAYIVTAIGVVGTVLGIIIVLSNILTTHP